LIIRIDHEDLIIMVWGVGKGNMQKFFTPLQKIN